MTATAHSETGRLVRVLLKHTSEAFRSQEVAHAEWETLRFTGEPDVARAFQEYERFVDLLRLSGADICFLDAAGYSSLDSIYVRDASVVCDRGVILCRMGKPQRSGEPAAHESAFRQIGVPILGRIVAPGTLEGGDVTWLDQRTIAVGRGYRTNDAGIAQLRALLGDTIDEMIIVSLPHWRGPDHVFHLMSIVSPVDRDLAVVYSPLMPVPFREQLLARGMSLVEVPDEEFESAGANVLAIAPRRCIMLQGNPITRARLERAGVEVLEYDGANISLKGGGGPTCLTRPLTRTDSSELPAGNDFGRGGAAQEGFPRGQSSQSGSPTPD
jgi:N-dimethylarginine dimethylaminohydrolase